MKFQYIIAQLSKIKSSNPDNGAIAEGIDEMHRCLKKDPNRDKACHVVWEVLYTIKSENIGKNDQLKVQEMLTNLRTFEGKVEFKSSYSRGKLEKIQRDLDEFFKWEMDHIRKSAHHHLGRNS
jgi:hypothetical protein